MNLDDIKELEGTILLMREKIGKQKMQMAVLRWAIAHKTKLDDAFLTESLVAAVDAELANDA